MSFTDIDKQFEVFRKLNEPKSANDKFKGIGDWFCEWIGKPKDSGGRTNVRQAKGNCSGQKVRKSNLKCMQHNK